MRRGYTLVEIMVAVAILGLIISIFVKGCGGCTQSRTMSRWTGNELVLKLPADCDKVLSFAAGREGEKDILYQTKDGTYKVKGYSDWGLLESTIRF